MSLHFVTGNKNKLLEAEKIIGISLVSSDFNLIEIQDRDVKKIAEHKVREAWGMAHEPVFVWDQAVYMDCLNGFPGPLIKWFWEQVTLEKMCQIANYFDNHAITTETALAYFDGKEIKTFTARREGTMPQAPRGDKGWGWDAIFIPAGSAKTYAEMDEDEMLQHRTHRVTLEKLRDYLKAITL